MGLDLNPPSMHDVCVLREQQSPFSKTCNLSQCSCPAPLLYRGYQESETVLDGQEEGRTVSQPASSVFYTGEGFIVGVGFTLDVGV